MPHVNSVDLSLSDTGECLQVLTGNFALYLHGTYEEMIAWAQGIVAQAEKKQKTRLADLAASVHRDLEAQGWKAEKNYGGQWEVTSPDHELQITFNGGDDGPAWWHLGTFTDSDVDGVATGRYVSFAEGTGFGRLMGAIREAQRPKAAKVEAA